MTRSRSILLNLKIYSIFLFFIANFVFDIPDIRNAWSAETVKATLAPSQMVNENLVTINIKTRKFTPETVTLVLNQKTRLTIKNHDSELHAFVPVGLLSKTHFHLTGNGAPEFGKEGLLRVLLPSRGQTEIVFIPSKPGNYPYFCDLPGHVMRGNIVVQENNGVVE